LSSAKSDFGANHLRSVDVAVVGGNLDRFSVIDDMVISHGVSISGDEEAGAFAGNDLFLLTRVWPIKEKLPTVRTRQNLIENVPRLLYSANSTR
jgi:hypothetical protein